jgi:hypothetical protein
MNTWAVPDRMEIGPSRTRPPPSALAARPVLAEAMSQRRLGPVAAQHALHLADLGGVGGDQGGGTAVLGDDRGGGLGAAEVDRLGLDGVEQRILGVARLVAHRQAAAGREAVGEGLAAGDGALGRVGPDRDHAGRGTAFRRGEAQLGQALAIIGPHQPRRLAAVRRQQAGRGAPDRPGRVGVGVDRRLARQRRPDAVAVQHHRALDPERALRTRTLGARAAADGQQRREGEDRKDGLHQARLW